MESVEILRQREHEKDKKNTYDINVEQSRAREVQMRDFSLVPLIPCRLLVMPCAPVEMRVHTTMHNLSRL